MILVWAFIALFWLYQEDEGDIEISMLCIKDAVPEGEIIICLGLFAII